MLHHTDILRVLEQYDLGKLYNITNARRGFVNETAFVTTDQGRFVVRRSHRRLSAAAHRYRHELINWLIRHDFPAPALIPTRNGATLVEIDGRFYEVIEFVEGVDFNSDRPAQVNSVGAVLAEYHRAVAGFAQPAEILEPRYSAQTMLGLTERLLERDAMGELYEYLSWYDMRAARLRALLPAESYKQLPHLLIHGDIHADNLLFMHDDVAALIDYDQITWDARIVDIADALIGFSTTRKRDHWLQWGVYQGPLDEERATRLISGYAEVVPLTTAEVQLLPVMVEIVWLQGELGRVISTPEGSPDYHQEVLEQGRWLSNWMQERYDVLAERWLAANKSATADAGERVFTPRAA